MPSDILRAYYSENGGVSRALTRLKKTMFEKCVCEGLETFPCLFLDWILLSIRQLAGVF